MVSLSAVELCLANAERLLADASKVTNPTAAALAELSIEEAGKAWMLYFRMLFQGRKPRHVPRVPPKDRKAGEDYLDRHETYLRALDKQIFDGFQFHKVKLRFITFLLGYIEVSLPVLGVRGRLVPLAQAIHGPAFNVNGDTAAPDLESVRRLINAFRLENFTELDKVKHRGLYINLSRSGDLISPEVEVFPTPLLGALAGFLIQTLKGDLLALSR
jgi:AbiV family abortive infection protein